MTWWSRLWRRNELEQDLGRELQFHIAERISALKSRGLSEAEARHRVRQEFGGIEQVKEECRRARGTLWVESTVQDVRYAIRTLRKSSGFALTAILTLGLGIGGTTAIFTLIHAVMLKFLPVADPQTLIRLGDDDNCCVLGGYQGRYSSFAYPLYTSIRDHTPEFEELTAFQSGLGRVSVRRVGANTASMPLVDQFVSGNFFTTFGLRPFAGRLLSLADDSRGALPVAVMSFRAWQQDYGSDPSIVGSAYIIDGATFTIVGIAPPGFFGAMMRPDPPDLWMPIADEPAAHKLNSLLDANLLARDDEAWLYVIGRIRRGTDLKRLEAKVNVELRQWLLVNDPPQTETAKQELKKQYIALVPAGGGVALMKSNYEHDLRLLMAITALVLLICCANLANLQLARGAANSSQISIRIALGAPRSRVIRHVLTESIVIAVTGGAAGLIVARELATLLIRWAFPSAQHVR
ncbi:MAG: ABC transporter permease [Acidobacteriaceae bacterium]|nr:ABC transporter permease [Acidobacteriaceae bacterium]MBV9295042.1 ABC transporter permease [Acidobacteriaceae bacterium]MBV9767003.1 ABC transporter permease [Acidobacteriaceae bacterium]